MEIKTGNLNYFKPYITMAQSYEKAGVNLEAGYEVVRRIKKHVASTSRPGVMGNIGAFGGMFDLSALNVKEPVLVSGTDGVGTKLKIAMLLDKHDTIGIDCVAMCVNDVICCGAKPLFFLDYIACGKNYPEKIASIVSGVAEGCVRAGCALIGGETAEHPGMMPEDDYDLAGFTVGIVNKPDVFDNKSVKAGDVIIALPSSGVHSNGFSLVRKVFDFDKGGIDKTYDELGTTIGEALLTPTEIYVKPVLALAKEVKIKAVSHITGGGFYENIPRSLPEGITAVIEKKALKILPVFDIIEKTGNIPERDMFNTFNMGVGMSITVAPEDADRAVRILRESGTDAYIIGETASGEDGVKIC